MPIELSSPIFPDARSQTIQDNIRQQSYDKDASAEIPRGADDPALSKSLQPEGRRSIFNPYHVFTGSADNDFSKIWTDEDVAENKQWMQPTIVNLLASKNKGLQYDEADFRYCKYYGEVPNNRLITMRRFPYPVADDIFSGYEREPDLARMVTWSTQENNALKELINMSFGLKWKTLQSESEQGSWEGDPRGADGYLAKVMSIVDPQYGAGAVAGRNRLAYDPQHDQNKVYGPVDSIGETHIRDVGLNFEMPITLKFHYELSGIDGINPKTAMVDLISNILAATTNNAKFWGGARYWVGYKPSSYANRLRTDSDKAFQDVLNQSQVDMKSYIGGIARSLKDDFKDVSNVNQIVQNISNLAFGKLLDKVGRASIPVMNSLLTGEPVGEWHLTIGNPFRPILCMGDMLLENTTITIGDETLGFDDFPTQLEVECQFKHAKPRGRAEIESMWNAGRGRTYWRPTDADLARMTKGGDARSSIQRFINKEVDWATRSAFSFAQSLT